jgi:hypothetical protein
MNPLKERPRDACTAEHRFTPKPGESIGQRVAVPPDGGRTARPKVPQHEEHHETEKTSSFGWKEYPQHRGGGGGRNEK